MAGGIVSKIFSIRYKILFLSLLGIIGVVLIAGMNNYLDHLRNIELEVGIKSQEIVQGTLQNAIIEQEFIVSPGRALLEKHERVHKNISRSLQIINSTSNDSKILDTAGQIAEIGASHAEQFALIAKSIFSVNQDKEKILEEINMMTDLINAIVTKVDQEETDLIMVGELLDTTKNTLRIETKDSLLLWNERYQNLQNLFLLASKENYSKKKKDLLGRMKLRENNIKTTLVGIKNEDLIQLCHQIFALSPKIDSLEEAVVREWEKNRILLDKLSAGGIRVKEAALHIADITRQNIQQTAAIGKNISLGVTAGVIVLMITVSLFIIRGIIKPIDRIVSFAGELKQGDLSTQLEESRDEIGTMSIALNDVVKELRAKTKVAKAISDGNLNQNVTVASEKDSLGQTLNHMLSSLNAIISDINIAIAKVDAGALQLTDSSQSLSQGATEQAASLEEITSSMTEIGSQANTNADNARMAKDLAVGSRDACEEGVAQMQEMNEAINAINDSSKEIGKIIKTIDDIAFQTNLLALNAAVEAARAGKHGKGFAVVAQEVRNLASRSAKAAQETAHLIEGSAQKVTVGNQIAEKTAKALNKINEEVGKVADLLNEIANASAEQAQGVSQIGQGLDQIDVVTQQNSANAEETNSAAEDLSLQASQVKKLLQRFQLKTTTGPVLSEPDSAADQLLLEG